ncbi:MAG: hypothetical protein ABR585_01480 [Gemmatimonadaceae bacterium]
MTIRLIQYLKPLSGIVALTIGACSSDLTGATRHMVQLSFSTKPAALTANPVAADVTVGPASELTLTSVKLVFGKIELDRSANADCVGEVEREEDNHEARHGDDCADVLRDPLLVDVLKADFQPVITIPLPAGTFSELEAKLEPAKDRAIDFNAANTDLVGRSVLVTGLIGADRKPFTFVSAMRANVEMDFDTPLIIDDATKNVTIGIDVRNWFLDSSGSVIDPSVASNQQRIENNIRRSFHAFEDENEDGEDHHEGHHGNDDGH